MSNTTVTVTVNEIPVDTNDATKTAWGAVLADQTYFAIAAGTAADETFDAADLSAPTRALMDTNQRGITVNMGGGDDTVIGSAYGDAIAAGSGTNFVDGGANLGLQPGGGKAIDMLDVYVVDAAAAAAVAVIALGTDSTGADAAAFSDGYKFKVTNGSSENTYIKNIEQVNVRLDADRSFVRSVSLAVQVHETSASGADLTASMHFAWANGSAMGDTFDAATDISSATRAKMDDVGRGVFVDTGAGDDTITGSAYGDNIIAGAGTNHIDGGANGGTTPWGGKAEDVLQITVASADDAAKIEVVALGGAGSADDIAAALAGYTHKVVNAAGGETDYIKGIERVSIQVFDGTSWSFGRDIALTVHVQEANLSDAHINDYQQVAWVNGTGGADVIDMSGTSALLSAPLAQQMASAKQGVWIDGGAGNDTITGTGYADTIRNGAGNSKVDGGANEAASGHMAKDVFEISVATQLELDAITVSASDDPLYTWMVTYGANSTQKDYLKNIEGISAYVSGGSSGKWIPLAIDVNEASGPNLSNNMHMAWANGTALDDNFDAGRDVSAATRTLMSDYGRGVFVDTGAGNDTIKGSGYGDDIYAGAGVNHVDGGANAGLRPYGGNAEDVLRLRVTDQTAADAVQVLTLDGTSGSTADIAEFNAGYTHKVVSGAETDYVKNIERISIQVDGGGAGREVMLAVSVQEANLGAIDIGNYSQVAWVKGTAGADSIDLSNGALLSTALQAQMVLGKQGVWIDGGAGNDVITGTGYADVFRNGAGNSRIDGGANDAAAGHYGKDVFEISVANKAALDSVQVVASDDPGYTWMVTYGANSTQKDYLKNIEGVSIYVEGGGNGKWVPLAIDVNEVRSADVATSYHYAWAYGTALADTFNAATDVSSATRALMAEHGRGVYVDTGAGNDTITGSAYADYIVAGAGDDYIDGGANGGTLPQGGRPEDVLQVTVASAAAAAQVTVTALSNSGSLADIDAFNHGYTHKVVQPAAGGETDYIKGIERVSIQVFDGTTWSYGRDIALAINVSEIAPNATLANYSQFAWAYGTDGADSFNANTDVSAATRALMDTYQRGVYADGGAGNDTLTGSAYGDTLIGGAGTNYIDGGANGGTGPGGTGKAMDYLRVTVASSAAAAAVSVTELTGAGSSADIAAYDNGYTHKLVNGTAETDYVKNIEAVDIQIFDGASYQFGRRIALAVTVSEANLADPHLSTFTTLATITGTDGRDVIDMSANSPLLSDAVKLEMASSKRGVYIDGGKGDDVITGTGYADSFRNGSGNSRIDGGANVSNSAIDNRDRFDIQVANKAELDAVVVSPSDDNGYTWMVTYGPGSTQKDYLKNIEAVSVFVAGGSSRWIPLAIEISENLTANLANTMHLASVYGTEAGDTFNASTDLSVAARTAMETNGRGVYIDMRGGNDTVVGTAYGDLIIGGDGTNYIDGGANGGTAPFGGRPQDMLSVKATSQAAYDGAVVTALSPASSGADLAAFNAGYLFKLANGSAETDYFKNIENIQVQFWNDVNSNGVPDQGETAFKSINMAVQIYEQQADPLKPGYLTNGQKIADVQSLASVSGTAFGDSFDAATDLSATVRALMDASGRGVFADLDAGDDTVTGSAYGDYINGGAGVNRIDGGAQGGTLQYGVPRDVLGVTIHSQADFDAFAVTALSSASTGADLAAFNSGYTFVVHNGASETDYIKGIETVQASFWNDANANGVYDDGETTFKSINTAPSISEERADPAKPGFLMNGMEIAQVGSLASVSGTEFADTFNAGTDLSTAVQALMDSYQLGVYVQTGAGNDIITGSAFGDQFTAGIGTNFIDGGANAGARTDTLNVYVADQATGQALVLQTLSSSSTGADAAAFAAGFAYKLDAGAEVDYIVNVESVEVFAGTPQTGMTHVVTLVGQQTVTS
jgi:hypothetical protein